MTAKKVFMGDVYKSRKKPKFTEYTHIRGYHACRPTDVASYIKNGIGAFSKEELKQSAIDLFGKEITNILADGAFKGNTGDKPEVHFCMFKSALLSHSGHYLCYGSEYLICIATRLDDSLLGPNRAMLLETGIPTIFACDVPIDYIPEWQLVSMRDCYRSYNDHTGFWIFRNLPPEYIIGHEHPAEMFDPYFHFTRPNRLTHCSLCES